MRPLKSNFLGEIITKNVFGELFILEPHTEGDNPSRLKITASTPRIQVALIGTKIEVYAVGCMWDVLLKSLFEKESTCLTQEDSKIVAFGELGNWEIEVTPTNASEAPASR